MRKAEISRPDLAAAAVRLAGGLAAVARICRVARQTIYDWINERRVERLIDALRLSRASGVAIEKLAGMMSKSWPFPFSHRARSAGRGRHRQTLRGP